MKRRGLDWTEISVVRNRRIRAMVGSDGVRLNTWLPVPRRRFLKRVAHFVDWGRRGG